MVLGLKYGRGENDDLLPMEETYRLTRALMDEFTEKHGSFICRSLLNGCELNSPEGQREYKEKEMRSKVCRPCVESVVQILEELI